MKQAFAYSTLTVLLSLLNFTTAVAAQPAFQAAQLLESSEPKYPTSLRVQDIEGWVLLSYVVDRQGAVVDPVIIDSSGREAFEEAMLEAVTWFRYQPATLDGKTVEQSFNAQKFLFRLPPPSYKLSRKFERRIRDIQRLIKSESYESATLELADVSEVNRRSLNEDAWYWYLYADLARAQGDKVAQREGLLRAVAYEDMYLPNVTHISALGQLYNEDVVAGRFAQAFDTSARLAPFIDVDRDIGKILKHSKEARDTLEDTEYFSTQAHIGSGRPWVQKLLRREVSFLVESGSLSHFEARCDTARQRFEISPQKAWRIPATWGQCSLLVYGEAGTMFFINES